MVICKKRGGVAGDAKSCAAVHWKKEIRKGLCGVQTEGNVRD